MFQEFYGFTSCRFLHHRTKDLFPTASQKELECTPAYLVRRARLRSHHGEMVRQVHGRARLRRHLDFNRYLVVVSRQPTTGITAVS